MDSKKLAPYIANLQFTPYDERKTDGRSIFLGYVHGTLVVPGGCDGSDFELEVYSLEVKVLNGKPFIDFPSEERDGTYYHHFRPANKQTRDAITASIFGDADIAVLAEPFLKDVEATPAPVLDVSSPEVQELVAALVAKTLLAMKAETPV